MFNLVQDAHAFTQSLRRVGVADGGIPNNPVGRNNFLKPSEWKPPGITAYDPANQCAETGSSSVDCGQMSKWMK